MNMDSLILTFKSVTSQMKSDLADAISKWKSLDDETTKASGSLKNLGTPLDSLKSKLKSTQEEYNKLSKTINMFTPQFGISNEAKSMTGIQTEDLRKQYENTEKQLDKLFSSLEKNSKIVDSIQDPNLYSQAVSEFEKLQDVIGKTLKHAVDLRDALSFREKTGTSYENAIQNLELLQNEIDDTKIKIEELSTDTPDILPNTIDAKYNLEDVGNEAEKTSSKFSNFKNTISSIGRSFSQLSGTLKSISKSFNNFRNSFGRGMDNTFKKVRKLALGLIGVRTMMSLLTKSVNAYLSFDSQLQASLKNSWNTLGALLAPAIELVANLFAKATAYVAQFVQALTGLDLVARANEKAILSQANATKSLGEAQRGLLGMDEITNLPTEPSAGGVSDIPQISKIKIDTGTFFDNLVKNLKNQNWHILGEEIGKNFSKSLASIPWEKIKTKAKQTGKNLASFLNGMFEFGWANLGMTIGEAINTALEFASGFLEEFSFVQFGEGIATTVKETFKKVKWDEVAEVLSDSLIGVLQTITTFLGDEDMADSIGNGIKDLIMNIKWKEIGEAIVKAIISGVKAQLNAIKGIFGDGLLGNLVSFAFGRLNPLAGLYNASGFFNGIGNWINGIFGLDTGTPEIETEGLYHLHEGEMVVPKRYNPNTNGYGNGQDNKEMIDLLVALNSNMVQYANRPIVVKMNGKQVAEGIYGYTQEISRNENKSTVVVRGG